MATTISGSRVEVCLASSYELGEGSLYTELYPGGGAYLHVDILGATVSVHRPALGGLVTYRLPSVVGTVVPVLGGRQLLVALAQGPAFVDLTTGAVARVAAAALEPALPLNRCNDGKVGPDGRFYFGTMHGATVDPRPASGALYVMDHDGSTRRLLEGITVSNGLAWSADGKTMYYIDTPRCDVQAFDFDAEKGAISNGRVAFAIPEGMGRPDGCTMDAEGHLWVALWGGWGVARFNVTTGEVLARIEVPASNVSSVAFGGPGLKDIYITTAKVREAGGALASAHLRRAVWSCMQQAPPPSAPLRGPGRAAGAEPPPPPQPHPRTGVPRRRRPCCAAACGPHVSRARCAAGRDGRPELRLRPQRQLPRPAAPHPPLRHGHQAARGGGA